MRSTIQIAFVLAVLLLALAPMTAYADGPVITTDVNGTTTQALDFRLPPDSRSGVFLLYVRNPLTATMEISAVRAYVHDAAAVMLPPETILFTNAQDNAPLNGIALQGNSAHPVLMRVNALPTTGVYSGVISVELKDAPPGFASLTLHSDAPPAPNVSIAQADANQKIALTAGTLDFEYPLTLWQKTVLSGTTPVTLTLAPLTRQDGSDATPVLLTLIDAANNITRANVLTTDLTTNVPRTLMLKGTLPRRAGYAGNLVLQYGDTVATYALAVMPGTDSIAVREFADGKITYTTGSEAWSQNLTLVTAEGAPNFPISSLRVTALTRQAGQPVNAAAIECIGCDAVREIGPNVPQTIELRARGLESTAYNAALEIWTQGYTKTFPIALTRAALRDSLSLSEPGTVAGTNWFPLAFPATVDVTVMISDTSNLTTTIYYPRLEPALQLMDKDNKVVNVSPAMVHLYERVQNGALIPITDTQATTLVDGHLPRAFVLQIGGLGSGSYKANVSVGGPDVKTVMRTGTLQVKDSVILPLLVMSLGVYLAYFLYHWSQRGRAQVARAAEIAERREYVLSRLKTVDKDPVWQEVLFRLNHLMDRNLSEETNGKEVNDTLTDIKTRLGLYEDVRIALSNVDVALSEYPAISDAAKQAGSDFRQRRDALFSQAQVVLVGTDNLDDTKKNTNALTMDLLKLAVEVRKSALSWLPQQMIAELGKWAELPELSAELKKRAVDLKMMVEKIVQDLNAVPITTDMAQAESAFKDLRARIDAAKVEFEKIKAELPRTRGAELNAARAQDGELTRGLLAVWNAVAGAFLPVSVSDANKTSADWRKALQQGDRMVLWIGLALSVLSGLAAQYITPATFGTLSDYVNAFMWGFGVTATTGFAAIAQQYKILDKSG